MDSRKNSPVITGKVTDDDWLNLFAKIYLADLFVMRRGWGMSWNASDRGSCFRECIDHFIKHYSLQADFWDIDKTYSDKLNEWKATENMTDGFIRASISIMKEDHAEFTLEEAKKEYVRQIQITN